MSNIIIFIVIFLLLYHIDHLFYHIDHVLYDINHVLYDIDHVDVIELIYVVDPMNILMNDFTYVLIRSIRLILSLPTYLT